MSKEEARKAQPNRDTCQKCGFPLVWSERNLVCASVRCSEWGKVVHSYEPPRYTLFA